MVDLQGQASLREHGQHVQALKTLWQWKTSGPPKNTEPLGAEVHKNVLHPQSKIQSWDAFTVARQDTAEQGTGMRSKESVMRPCLSFMRRRTIVALRK
jgi:hypothetical protein